MKVTHTHVSLTVLYSYLKPDFPPFLCPWSLCLSHRLCQLPHPWGLTAVLSLRSWARSSTNKRTSVRLACQVNCPASKPWTHTGRYIWLLSDNFHIVSSNGIKISRSFVPGADEFMRADTEPRSCGVLGTASIGAAGQRHRTGVIYLECHWTCFLKGKRTPSACVGPRSSMI